MVVTRKVYVFLRHSSCTRSLSSSARQRQTENTFKDIRDASNTKEDVTASDSPAVDAVKQGLIAARKKARAELLGEVILKPLPQIEAESAKRYMMRYSKPSKSWAAIMRSWIGEGGESKTLPASMLIRQMAEPRTSVKIDDLFEPLDIGDAVELNSSLNQSVLSVIVELPSSDKDPRYTIMNRLGELAYLEKSAFKFRIPKMIPKAWLYRIIHKVDQSDPSVDYGSIKTTFNGFEMYTVNNLAKKIISVQLSKVTNSAWTQLQETSRKIEILHRILQTNGPREISLVTLVKGVKALSLSAFKSDVINLGVDEAYGKLSNLLKDTVGAEFSSGISGSILGKEYGAISGEESHDASSLYSIILAIRKQDGLWSSSYSSRTTFIPLSITALPYAYSKRLDDTVDRCLSNPGIVKSFHAFLEKADFTNIQQQIQDILHLLKEYAVGNVVDARSEALVCRLLKDQNQSYITKTLVWDLLVQLGYIDSNLTNPSHFKMNLALPNKDVSKKADLEEEFYQLVDVTKDRNTDLANSRKDLSDMRVYCIDSETAHEIDDGISIEHVNKTIAKLHIHIADPTSYLNPNSTLCKIAFERAFTTYQPEMISAMFPKAMSDLAGLGVDSTKTRAMTFSIPVDKATGVVDFSEAEVSATHVSRFPKYTYNDVDSVLKKVDANGGKTNNEEHQDLKEMHEMSLLLRANRVKEGAVIYPESLSVQIRVKRSLSEEKDVESIVDDGNEEISIERQIQTPSVTLVTEFMILANRIAAIKLSQTGRSGVYKTMPSLPLAGSAKKVLRDLNYMSQNVISQKSTKSSLSEVVKSFKFITPAIYSSQPGLHAMLGCDHYAPSTSPLRRFGDIINHFQFHSYLNGESPVFSEGQVRSMVLHIESRNDILKKANKSAIGYYSMKYLKEELVKQEKSVDKRFLVVSRPFNGFANGILLGYGVFGRMKLLENRKPPMIGDILSKFEIVELDSVGGNLILEE